MKKICVILTFLFMSFNLSSISLDELYSLIEEQESRYWIPLECLNVLFKDNKNTIKEYYPDIQSLSYYDYAEDRIINWDEFECFSNFCIVKEYDFENDALCIAEGGALSFYFSYIKSVDQCVYLDITKTYNCKQLENYNPFSKWPIKEDECIMILQFDGDYLNVYLNDLKNYYGTFCKIDKKTLDEYNSLISTGKSNLSRVTWPRHADGTCDYEDVSSVKTVSTPSTNVAKNKTMTVSENLKLRSAEATTSDVLTVMSAGTKVKILELGKAENIDGINSNWVKVEVLSGAKDRDGRAIRAGTVGWCYGEYLK